MGNSEEEQMIIGWKAIALKVGVSEWALKHRLYRACLRLPKLNPNSRTSQVYTTLTTINSVLKHIC